MLNGVVLWLQAAPCLQREEGTAQLHADPETWMTWIRLGKPHSRRTSRETRRGQGVHKQGAVRETVRGPRQHTAPYQTPEQHERCTHDHRRQDPA